MRIGSDPTDEELEAWADSQALGPWTPNDDVSDIAPAIARLTVRVAPDVVAELEAEAALHRQPAHHYARDLLLLALRQAQAARGAWERPSAGRVPGAIPLVPEPPPAAAPLTAGALCTRYASRVYRFAAMAARGPADADGLAQAALERAIRALPTYDATRGDVEGWLWRIVAGAARARRRPDALRWPLARRPGRDARQPPRAASDEALLAAVRALPRRQRAALGLRYGADLDLRTAGAALGISAAAAGGLVRHALDRLRSKTGVEHRLRALELRPPPDLPGRALASAEVPPRRADPG